MPRKPGSPGAVLAPPSCATSQAALAIGSLASSLFFSSLFLALTTGAAWDFLRQPVVLRQFFELGFEFGAARGDLFQQFVGCVLAQRGEFLDAQRIPDRSLPCQPPVCFWLPGRRESHKRRGALSTANVERSKTFVIAPPPQSCNAMSAFAPQSRRPICTGPESRDGHDRPGQRGFGTARNRRARRALQGDAGKVQARARRVLRHDAGKCASLRNGSSWISATAVLVVSCTNQEKPGACSGPSVDRLPAAPAAVPIIRCPP